MTLLINAVVFVAALPLSVWLLSQMLALIDEPDRSHPLIRLAARAILRDLDGTVVEVTHRSEGRDADVHGVDGFGDVRRFEQRRPWAY